MIRFQITTLLGLAWVAGGQLVLAQGAFQNLDFENGTFIPILGDPYGRIEWGAAMPGWTGYVGTNQIDRCLYNDLFVGTASISLLGTGWPGTIIEGNYSLLLQAGARITGGATDVSIAQTSLIPVMARSLLFRGFSARNLSVTIGGQPLTLVDLGQQGNSLLFGADVTEFAGTFGELRFTALALLPQPANNLLLDSIEFSPQSIPEPSALALFTFGSGWLAWSFRRRRH